MEICWLKSDRKPAAENIARQDRICASSKEQWGKIACEFNEKWQSPHCVGAIDGKHMNIRAPPNTGSEYYNYKNHFSIVLLAIADANAQFITFQLGDAGS